MGHGISDLIPPKSMLLCIMTYFVYILSNKLRTVFYTGVTSDLKKRVFEHKTGAGGFFTSRYNCCELMYFEKYSFIHEAIAREKVLKKYRRDWKIQMIKAFNPEFKDLGNEL